MAHSVSPAMQNAAFRALGLDAVYVAIPCQTADVGRLMQVLAKAGGGGNVTIPHKSEACSSVDRYLGSVVGACNTFWGWAGELLGDNTDAEGIRLAVETVAPQADRWLVLGTGGSAKAVLEAARQAGAGIAVRSRSPGRAQAFTDEVRGMGLETVAPETCSLVINTTPLGLHREDEMPLPPERMPAGAAALDLVYAPGLTRWVRELRDRGTRAVDGREVLLYQGVGSFRRWYPDVEPPVDVMRAALVRALD